MKPSLWYACVCQVLLAACWLSPAAADTLYSNPHVVPSGAGWYTWCSTRATNGDSVLTYDSFTVSEAVTVTEVSWVGCYIDESRSLATPPTPATTSWEINFHANSGAQPGAQVYSQILSLGQVSSVFVSDETFDDNGDVEPIVRRKYTALLPTPALLQPGTYWFSPRSVQPVIDPHFSWMGGAEIVGDCIQVRNLGSGIETLTRQQNRAFTIIGHPTPPSPGISLAVNGTTVASGGNASAMPANLGTERQIQIVITNPGAAQLQNISAGVTAGSPVFRLGPQPPASTLNPGSPTAFLVIFTPPALGEHTGAVQVTSNADPSPYLIHFSVSGVDSSPPLISPQATALTIVDGAPGNATTVSNWLQAHGGASATDNGGSVTWSHNFTALPSVPGSASVTFTAQDGSGNQATTSAAINVLDQTPPAINTPPTDLQVFCDDPDRTAQITAWLASHGGASATDNSGSFTWSHNYTTQPGPCGNVSVTFTAKDPSNNSSAATAKIHVLDTTAPALGAQATGLTVESDGNGNVNARNAWLNNHGGATATDNCSGVTWTHSFTSLANNLPQTVPVTFTAKDSCGQPSTTSANFIIQDTTPPQVTVQAKDFYGDCHEAQADLTVFLNTRGGASATDIAGPITWSNDYNGTLPDCKGYIVVTFTATDTVGLTASTSCRFFLFPPGAVWTGPATGVWSTAASWRSQVPNASLDAYVDLFDFQDTTVTVTGTSAVKSLYIGAGDELVHGTSSLTINGPTIHNEGILRIRTPGDLSGNSRIIYLPGPISLEGSGKTVLTGPGRNIIDDTTSAGIVTVGAGHEIITEGATVANYQATAIHAGIVNHGTVTADGGGLTLDSAPKTNHALFRAINGGFLDMESNVDNTDGTFFAGPGSTLHLESTLTGGTVTGTGQLLVDTNAGLTGPITLDSGLTTALHNGNTWLSGTITHNGVLNFGSATSTGTAYMHINGPVTLQGSGKMVFQNAGRRQILRDNAAATDVLTLGPQMEITTSGPTDSNYQSSSIHVGVVNHGIITVDQGQLSLYSQPKTNHGLLRAINGGFLDMEADVINTDATLYAGPGSTLHLESTLTGGTVTGTGTLLMDSNGGLTGPITLDSGLTTNLHAAGLWLAGNVTLNGVLNFGSATSDATCYMYINGPVNLDGSGKIIIKNAGRRQILRDNNAATDVLTVGPGIEITTSGPTGLNYQASALHAPMINHGTVTVNGGGLTIYSQSKTNHGTFRAINGGYMDFLSVTVTNYNATTDTLTGGRWEVESNGTATTMDFSSMPVATIAAGTTVRLSGANASIPQLSSLATMAGTLILENGNTLTRSGNLAIPGVLEYGLPAALNTTRLAVTGNVNFTGTTINIRDLGLTSGSYLLASWTGSVTGAPVLGSLPSGSQHSLVLDPVAKTLRLQVTVIPPVEVISFTTTPADELGPDAGKRHVHLSGQGQANTDYRVHASADLELWVPVSEVLSSPSGALEWEFLQDPGFPQRFYRFEPE